MTFYQKYLLLCKNNKKSPSGAALEMGLSKTTVHRWKNGGGLTDATAITVADYFGITVANLMSGVEEQKEAPAAKGEGFDSGEAEFMRLWKLLSPERQARELAFLREEVLKSEAEQDS